MKFNVFGQIKLALFGAALGIGQVAFAQDIVSDVDPQTEAGPLSIVMNEDGFTRALNVGDTRFFADGEFQYLNVVAQRGSLYLVELGAGGNACPAQYVWLHTAPSARITDLFGNCSYVEDTLSDAETVTVVMKSGIPAQGQIGFVYDGRTIVETAMGQVSAGIGMNPRDWIGRAPYEVFADADWRKTLTGLMGDANYRRVGRTMERSTGFEQVENWIAAQGFSPMLNARAAMMMNMDTGQVIVVHENGDGTVETWGDDGSGLPEAILALIEFR